MMTSVRSAKQKGANMEYSVYDSLKPLYPDIRLTKQLGFVGQYDLISDKERIVIECKRHKGFSWNELVKYFEKLKSNTPITENPIMSYIPLLVFQANHQPCLVMFSDKGNLTITQFKDYFGIPFIKHIGIKRGDKI